MKPTPETPLPRRNGESIYRRRRRPALLTDFAFQNGAGGPFGRGGYGRGPDENSRSHLVSPDYYRDEMQREFFVEAAAFAIIVVVTAWPIAALIHLIVVKFID